MDLTLCQVDRAYLHALQNYGRIVQQRNALLARMHGRADPAALEFWDERLVSVGAYIMQARKWMLGILSEFAAELYADLSGSRDAITVRYAPSVQRADVEADIVSLFTENLRQVARKEMEQRVTLVGPHRDDLSLLIGGVSLQSFGSRGQQRTAALALRMAESRYMTNRTGERAILLLDEALSELDERRRELLLRFASSHPQVIMTSSTLRAFPDDFRVHAALLRVEAGNVERENVMRLSEEQVTGV
jgi:DNA replication and repair protein RecF